MSIVGDVADMDHVRRGTDHRGKTFFYCYTDEFNGTDSACVACRHGECLQKVVWYLDKKGKPDISSAITLHDMQHELS